MIASIFSTGRMRSSMGVVASNVFLGTIRGEVVRVGVCFREGFERSASTTSFSSSLSLSSAFFVFFFVFEDTLSVSFASTECLDCAGGEEAIFS